MISPDLVPLKVTSSEFMVGLVALKIPVAENGPVAAATAFVQFQEELPAQAISTNARVFSAAERVFRAVHHLDTSSVGIRESSLIQSVSPNNQHWHTEPDGIWDGAKVWLSPA
jgi:hypothetical protein